MSEFNPGEESRGYREKIKPRSERRRELRGGGGSKPRDKSDSPDSPSRRGLLKGFVAAIGLVAAAKAGLTLLSSQEAPRTENLPEDVLTEEELKQAHITIYQTLQVQLYLRRSALDIPLFQDVLRGKYTYRGEEMGKLNGLVIALVDSDSLNWDAISNLPEDARLIWQGGGIHPSEYTEEEWQKIIKSKQDNGIYLHNLQLSSRQESERKKIQEEIDRIKLELEIFQDRPRAISYLASHRDSTGLFFIAPKINPEDLVQDKSRYKEKQYQRKLATVQHPEWYDKAYLYLAVGGVSKPSIAESYPRPDQFKVDRQYYPEDYIVTEGRSIGFTLWHEVSHHVSGTAEGEADELALKNITDAWEHFRRTGDSSRYPFIFKTDEGLIFTKRQTSIQGEQHVV